MADKIYVRNADDNAAKYWTLDPSTSREDLFKKNPILRELPADKLELILGAEDEGEVVAKPSLKLLKEIASFLKVENTRVNKTRKVRTAVIQELAAGVDWEEAEQVREAAGLDYVEFIKFVGDDTLKPAVRKKYDGLIKDNKEKFAGRFGRTETAAA